MQQSVTRAFQPKKDTGECSSTKLKSTCKNSGSFEGKKNYPEKVTYVSLAPSQIIEIAITLKLTPLSINKVTMPLVLDSCLISLKILFKT